MAKTRSKDANQKDNDTGKKDIVYVLTNPAMPGYVKIGVTGNLDERMRTFYDTNVPFPFVCNFAGKVKDAEKVEKHLFAAFADHRRNPKREFFEISPDKIVEALQLADPEDVTRSTKNTELTPEEKQALEQEIDRQIRAPFNFKMVDIPIDAELSFAHDENVKAKVLDNHRIELNGEPTFLSPAAQKLLGYPYRVAGPLHWMYEGETLDERRRRMEGEE